ncbi:MAG TPA: hypothetical protein VFY90_05850 [Tepidiformaceae bacterium]|jgi:hypothetical protein|nr:hypothetical protein [Tepidiformaceae bacterium]
MKDLDPGRSGREDYNPETEGKPADRTTGKDNNPGGMQGSPSDHRHQGQSNPQTDRDRKRDQQSDRDRGMQGTPGERDRDKAIRDPREDPNDQSGAGSHRSHDELNDEDTASESGTRDRGASRGHEKDRDRNR